MNAKILKKVAALILVFTMIPAFSLFTAAEDDMVGGTWGELEWTFNQTTGELVISGEGKMKAFSHERFSTEAWKKYKYSIQSVVVENGITSIGAYAFYDCAAITSITLPNSVFYIDRAAFRACVSLTSITLPNNLGEIGLEVFYDCHSLTSMPLSDSVSRIDDYAFAYCNSITDLYIPNTVTVISEKAF